MPISLILCDIDFFKPFNDHYGHQGGDDCLKSVAKALQAVIKRPGDVLARYGGEEFAVILPETPAQGAMAIAEEMKQTMKKLNIPHAYSSVENYVTLSLGVTSLDSLTQDAEVIVRTLIEQSDKALYQAKAAGKNQALLYNGA
jgi:diguanylate cyclase (GGDEF)-like protein